MRIAIDAKPRGGLRVIPELEISALSRLEGYNGIGKSAAVRLLLVCIGRNPYPADSALWNSFIEGLGVATVVITDIRGAERIEWRLDSATWANADSINPGLILIDGQESTLEEVRRLIDVERIVGNEGIAKTLAVRFAPSSLAMATLLAGPGRVNTNLQEMDRLFSELEKIISATKFESLGGIKQRVDEHLRLVENTKKTRDQLQADHADAKKAFDLVRQLTEIRGSSEQMKFESDELKQQIAVNESQIDKIRPIVEEGARKTAAATKAAKALRTAQDAAESAGRRVGELEESVKQRRKDLGVNDDSIQSLRSAAQAALNSAEDLRHQMTTGPRLQRLAETISDLLRQHEADDLADEIIVEFADGAANLTVTDLRLKLERRSLRLSGLGPADGLDDLVIKIRDFTRTLGLIDDLERAELDLAKSTAALLVTQQKVASASDSLASKVDHTSADVVRQMQLLETRTATLSQQLNEKNLALQALSLGMSEPDLTASLTKLLAKMGIADVDVADHLHERAHVLDTTETALSTSSAELRLSESQLHDATLDVKDLLRKLASDPGMAWLRKSIPNGVPAETDDIGQQQEFLSTLNSIIEVQRSRIDQSTQDSRNLSAAFAAVGNNLNGEQTADNPWVSLVRRWFGIQVSDWFNEPALVNALFDDGQDIRLDIAEMSVHWVVDGESRSRPLNAFSSGEQAFAYTRAQLGLLDHSPQLSANRIIALDEFGAFMAKEWLDRLEDYLRQRAANDAHDLTLLILPVGVTIAELKAQAGGSTQLAELESRHYSIKDLIEA